MTVDGVEVDDMPWITPLFMLDTAEERAESDRAEEHASQLLKIDTSTDGIAMGTAACDRFTPLFAAGAPAIAGDRMAAEDRTCARCGRGKANHALQAQTWAEIQALQQQQRHSQRAQHDQTQPRQPEFKQWLQQQRSKSRETAGVNSDRSIFGHMASQPPIRSGQLSESLETIHATGQWY
jgi:hypothetical protein